MAKAKADQAKARRQAPAAAPVEPVERGGWVKINKSFTAGALGRPILRPALVVAGYFSGFTFALALNINFHVKATSLQALVPTSRL